MNAKYQVIAQTIRDNIRLGVWPPGYRLPTRFEMITLYGTTVVTLQKAMDELLHDGFIIAAGKSGTFVADNPPNLNTFGVVIPAAPENTGSWDSFWTLLTSCKHQYERQLKVQLKYYYLSYENAECPDFRQLLNDVADQRLAGVIFPHPPDEGLTAPLLAARMPCAAVTADHLPGVNTVWVDFAGFLKQSYDDLLRQNARKIAVIANIQLPYECIDELAAHAKKSGSALPPEWRLGLSMEFDPGHWGSNLIRLLMTGSGRPDGLIIANENLAEVTLSTLRDLGLTPGKEVKVAQHVNFPALKVAAPGVCRFGFETDAVLARCIQEIRRSRADGKVTHDALIFAVKETR